MKKRRIQFIFIAAALLAAGLYTKALASSALGQLQAQSYPPLQIRAAAGAEVTVETPAGLPVASLRTNFQGQAVTEPLAPGRYLIRWPAGRACFLWDKGRLTVQYGQAWADGPCLHLGLDGRGAVTVFCPTSDYGTVYYYDLVGPDFCKTLAVCYDPEDPDGSSATLYGVPAGSYRLLENGENRAWVTVAEGEAQVTVLPGSAWPASPPR